MAGLEIGDFWSPLHVDSAHANYQKAKSRLKWWNRSPNVPSLIATLALLIPIYYGLVRIDSIISEGYPVLLFTICGCIAAVCLVMTVIGSHTTSKYSKAKERLFRLYGFTKVERHEMSRVFSTRDTQFVNFVYRGDRYRFDCDTAEISIVSDVCTYHSGCLADVYQHVREQHLDININTPCNAV